MRSAVRRGRGRVQAGEPLRQNVGSPLRAGRGRHGGTLRQILTLLGRHLVTGLGDDQDLLQMAEVRCRLDNDIDIRRVLRVRYRALDHSDRQPAGINLISTAGNDAFAGLDPLIGKEIDDLRLAQFVAPEDTAQTSGLEEHPGSAALIGNLEHLGRMGKHVFELADDAVRGNDRHIRLEAVARTLVDEEDARLIGAGGANHLRRRPWSLHNALERKAAAASAALGGHLQAARPAPIASGQSDRADPGFAASPREDPDNPTTGRECRDPCHGGPSPAVRPGQPPNSGSAVPSIHRRHSRPIRVGASNLRG